MERPRRRNSRTCLLQRITKFCTVRFRFCSRRLDFLFGSQQRDSSDRLESRFPDQRLEDLHPSALIQPGHAIHIYPNHVSHGREAFHRNN